MDIAGNVHVHTPGPAEQAYMEVCNMPGFSKSSFNFSSMNNIHSHAYDQNTRKDSALWKWCF